MMQASPFSLSPVQYEIFQARKKHRFRVFVAGRRSGKTRLICVEAIRAAVEKPNALVWIIEPTYRMARRLAFDLLVKLLPRHAVANVLVSELRVELKNGAVIECHGAENYDALRGPSLSFAGIDEFASMNVKVWTEVLRPALADQEGGAMFGGTPMGFAGGFYPLYQRGLGARPSWKSWQVRTIDAGWVSQEEIDAAREDMDPRTFRQEFEATFETAGNRILYAFDRHVHVPGPDDLEWLVDDPLLPLVVGIDFNVVPHMSATIGVVRARDDGKGRELHIFDEIALASSNTFELSQEITKRYGIRGLTATEIALRERYGHIENTTHVKHRPREIVGYPDASGNQRHTNAVAGQTDFAILQQAGIRVVAPPGNPPVKDRLNTSNAIFRNAKGEVRCYVHPRCKHLIASCEGWSYKEGSSIPDKTSGLDHFGDAFGYLACGVMGLLGVPGVSSEPIPAPATQGYDPARHMVISESMM